MANEEQKQLFTPDLMEKIARLEVRAKTIVEGLLEGFHKSRSRGFNIEFLEHRQYYPGDDIRHIDWKVYARSGRHAIKQYEVETNLHARLLLDASASMRYGADSAGGSKYEYCGVLAAALAYLMLKQGDAVGLTVAGGRISEPVAPVASRPHLYRILGAIESADNADHADIAGQLRRIGDTLRRKCILMIFSDLLEEPGPVMEQLKWIRGRGVEIALFHVLHEDEVSFPFTRAARFVDPESDLKMNADPTAVKSEYMRRLSSFIDSYSEFCSRVEIDFVTTATSMTPEETILRYLRRRER